MCYIISVSLCCVYDPLFIVDYGGTWEKEAEQDLKTIDCV